MPNMHYESLVWEQLLLFEAYECVMRNDLDLDLSARSLDLAKRRLHDCKVVADVWDKSTMSCT